MRWIKAAAGAAAVALCLSLAAPGQAQAVTVQEDFIAKLVGPAQENERRTGIPASVAIGMAALETGWGRSSMAGKVTVDAGLPTQKIYDVNTLFNIKCTSYVSPHQTGCVPIRTAEYRPDGTAYFITAEFRTYKSWGDSLLDYGRLLTSNSRYAKAFNYKAYPDQFVTEVRAGGYATDPKYASLVINIMQKYGLYKYNLNKAGTGFPPSATPTPKPTASPTSAKPTTSPTPVKPTPTPVKPTPTPVKPTPTPVKPTPTKPAPTPTKPAPVKPAPSKVTLPTYASGSRGSGVRSVQSLLNANGAKLKVDGIYGKLTVNAVKAFQKKHRITQTGKVDAATWSKLLPTLSRGSRSASVRVLQTELREAGHRIAVDGIYGPATEKAVRAVQTAKKVSVTGKVDLATWSKLIG